MKILIVTQKVDRDDPVLGFFHRWIVEFAKNFEQVTVICLGKGAYDLPANVKVLSLGKEKKASRLQYIRLFYKYIWQERKNYDSVFVHMNQEYVLLGGLVWRLWRRKIFLWRNHKMGNLLTRLAVLLSSKVFCTSRYSFTAQFKKTKLMPVGIDSHVFRRLPEVRKTPHSILFLGRIAPVKRVDVFIKALSLLKARGQNFFACIYGRPTPVDFDYFEKIKKEAGELTKNGLVIFEDAVTNTNAPVVYNSHEIFVNLTDSGSFDKTIVEAMLCESLVLVSNQSLSDILESEYLFKDRDAVDLSDKLMTLLNVSAADLERRGKALRERAEINSLETLIRELVSVMK